MVLIRRDYGVSTTHTARRERLARAYVPHGIRTGVHRNLVGRVVIQYTMLFYSRAFLLVGSALYLHCWGGRGRAGLVGACLLSLLRPELDGAAVLDTVQRAYRI